MGGIVATNLTDVTLRFEGTVVYDDSMKQWPREQGSGHVLECLHFVSPRNLTITSSGVALFDGRGAAWWGIPGVGYLEIGEDRPRLLRVQGGTDVLVENVFLLNSPYWTTYFDGATNLEVRNVGIDARRTREDGHGVVDITAFNTDGFDVTGRNVWIHDCTVWNQGKIAFIALATVPLRCATPHAPPPPPPRL